MNAYSMIDPKSRDDDSIHTYGSRVCARSRVTIASLVLAMTVAVPCGTLLAAGPEPVDLGTAAPFGVLAGAAISGTGHVKGDVGAVGAIAPAITSTGTIYPMGHAVVTNALEDFATAYSDGKNRAYDVELSAAAYELGGTTLTPGVYRIGAAATLATPVTLDADGDPEAVFIIQIVGALGTTASTGNVILTNDAQSANVFWIVEGAVSTGADTHMEGTILGNAGIAFGADTTINGRLLAGTAVGTIAMATTVSVPVEPSVVGGWVWFDADGDGIQEPSETTGFPDVPVTLLQLVFEKLTIDLRTAADFGALAGAAISGTGHVEGDVGSGTGAIAPAITSTGTVYSTGHAVVMTALEDFATAYSDGKNRAYDVELSAAAYELGGTTLTPGVYRIGAAATLATPVTLDADGDPEAVFIMQIVGALGTTASTGNVILTNDAQSANVFWIVEGAVSLGAGTHMEGNILGGADITFGADTTINGRALTGTAAGTIALATTVSAVTGTPPVGYPPPIVAADTVTDANGNYLFEGVQPGTYIVRWDLSSVTNDFRITEAHQGDDDTLDSDGVSGDVGGFVYTMEIEVLAGTTHLSVDLGLVETLPAIKAVALEDLETALAAHLLENYYTEENWEALKTAKTDGDAAINAATDPAGVAEARDAALAAMDAVPTMAETLAAAKAAALDDLATALATYVEADYTAENWTTLNTAKTDGDAAINEATDLAGVAAARDAALAAMDAVPTVDEDINRYALEIVSEHGDSSLPAGVYTNDFGTMLTNRIGDSPLVMNGTQYVAAGWTMIGHEPQSGTATQMVMTVTNDAVLTWQWATNYWLSVEAADDGAHGGVSADAGWQPAGSQPEVVAVPSNYYHLTYWSGDTELIENGDTTNPVVTVRLDRPATLIGHFAADLAPLGTPHWWLAQHGLIADGFAAAELRDSDGDGMSNWQEYIADTCPTNAASVLRLDDLKATPEGTHVRWRGGVRARQILERTHDLSRPDAWYAVFTNDPPTKIEVDYIDPNPEDYEARFYRIRANRP